MSIVHEKLDQAGAILDELDIDAWLTFVRETTETGDPVLPLILGQSLTWQSALLVTRRGAGGERIAIVGKYEDEAVRSTGAWPSVVPYVQSIRAPLVEALDRINPRQIAINYSMDDVKADGLSHGLHLVLLEHLKSTPHANRLISAAPVIGVLRGRKSRAELDRIRAAIATTEAIFREIARFARPGVSEREVHAFMHEQARSRGVGLAWSAEQCPIVSTGPESMLGHAIPSETLRIEQGRIFHLDFGVRQDEYCSDVQRAWYVPDSGERKPPAQVQRAFDAIVRAIRAAAAALRPGALGWQVDAAARRVITDAGYPEYQHATGHNVGRAAHDGGAVLGPQWDRYGRTPFYAVEEGNVFTLELGIDNVEGRGYLGLEEMVLVTREGCEWLTTPQTTLPLLAV